MVAALLAYEHSLVKPNDLSKMNAAFFAVNGYISLLFLLFWGAAAVGDAPVSSDPKMNGNLQIADARLEPIAQRVLAGERLTADDGLALFQSHDLLAVGWLANHVREKRHGNVCYFNVNRHINPTNVCVAHCKLCAFGRSPDSPGAYTFALDEIYPRAAQGVAEGATEFHIVGGLHPDLPFDYYLELIRGLKQRFPQVHLKAFTMVEVHYYARLSKLSIPRHAAENERGGRGFACPAAAPKFFIRACARIICDHKVSGQMWLPIARTAHELGLRSNATMLFGHVETLEERVDHLVRLRESQDKTHGFVAFIPLEFHPANTALAHLPKPTGMDALKTIAVSRLMLDNFDHIKAYWIMLTPRIAQIALGSARTIWTARWSEEKIYHDAGATTPEASRAPNSNG